MTDQTQTIHRAWTAAAAELHRSRDEIGDDETTMGDFRQIALCVVSEFLEHLEGDMYFGTILPDVRRMLRGE